VPIKTRSRRQEARGIVTANHFVRGRVAIHVFERDMKPLLFWFRHAVLKSELPLVIPLGCEIGDVTVKCDLLRTETRWHTPNGNLSDSPPQYPLRGLLYFEFEFNEFRKASLMSARINITLKDPDGKEKVLVDKTFPGSDAVKPQSVLMKERSSTQGAHFEPNAQTPAGGGSIGSVSGTRTISSPVEQTWSFKSTGKGADGAEFAWRRNTSTDWTGTDRGYGGAIAVRRKEHKDIRLECVVTIWAEKNRGFGRRGFAEGIIRRSDGESLPIKTDFDALAGQLPRIISDRNQRPVNRRKAMALEADA
jgi:hypothetical protein